MGNNGHMALSKNIPTMADFPAIFNKKDLCRIFNVTKKMLPKKVVTDEVLADARMTRAEYMAVRGGFTLQQSTRLRDAILRSCSNGY